MATESPSVSKKLHLPISVRFRDSATWSYISLLLESKRAQVALAVALMACLSLTEGVVLLLLLPLLQLIGFDAGVGTGGDITLMFSTLFNRVGLPVTLVTVLGVYVLIVSLYALLNRWQNNVSYTVAYEFQSFLRERLYRAIIHTNWLFFTRHRASTFTHALTAEIERVGFGTEQLLQLLVSIMVAVVYLVIALQLAPVVTVAVVLSGLILLIALRNKTSVSRTQGTAVSVDMRDLYGAVTEHLDGMKTVKSYGVQEQNAALFSNLNKRVTKAYVSSVRNWSDTRSLFDIGSVLILSGTLVVLIDVLHLPSASVLLLVFLFFRLIPRFSTIQQSYQYFVNMLPSFANVTDIQASCEAAEERTSDIAGEITLQRSIEFRKVSFAYNEEGRPAVDDINFSIKAAETSAIVGVSGAGKSTLADLLMGLILPQQGEVLIDGTPLTPERLHDWRSCIGYVAQETFLFNDTVRANLLWARPDASDGELCEALRMAAAEEFVRNMSDGLETVLGDRGVRVSGGERQRLALARALLRTPTVLLLDEATSSLDSENEKRIQDAIEALHGDMTIVIITHRLSTIRNADIIHVLEDGRVIESGDWATLSRKENGRFNELRQIQGVA